MKHLVEAYRNHAVHGFSLLELIVAVGLFTVVVFGMTTALLSVVSESQRSQANQEAVNNINVAVDEMVRNLSSGFYYDCGNDDPTERSDDVNCPPSGDGDTAVSFVNQDREQTSYYLDKSKGRIMKKETDDYSGGGGDTFPITSPNITVDTLRFYVSGAKGDDGEQSTTLITVSGTAGTGENQDRFTVQTSVTKRLLNP